MANKMLKTPIIPNIVNDFRDLPDGTTKFIKKLQNYCRLCLGMDPMKSINEKYEEENITYSDMAFTLTNLMLTNEDNEKSMPKFICITCCSKLVLFYKFKEKCLYSDLKLKEFICSPGGKNPIQIEKDDNNDRKNNSSDEEKDPTPLAQECKIINLNKLELSILNQQIKCDDKKIVTNKLLKIQTIKKYEQTNKNSIKKLKSIPPAQCDECGRMYKRKSDLAKHFLSVHKGFKQFQCDICQMRFTRKSHLITHMLIHNQIKPFTCDICGHSFRKSSNLNRHKVVHSNQFCFSCEFCGKQFKRLANVKLHKRIHTGRRIYQCDLCANVYQSSSGYQKHKAMHHRGLGSGGGDGGGVMTGNVITNENKREMVKPQKYMLKTEESKIL